MEPTDNRLRPYCLLLQDAKRIPRSSALLDSASFENMDKARIAVDGVCTWVGACFCATPLEEERPYWEQYFDLLNITDAHSRKNCHDTNGIEAWACCDCNCTRKLERNLQLIGKPFVSALREKR